MLRIDNNELNDILSIMKYWQNVFIAKEVGVNYLTSEEKSILQKHGVDISEYETKKGTVEHAFLFGMLSEALGDSRSKKMNYDQFKRFVESGSFLSLTDEEEFALLQVKNRAYTDMRGLGNRIASGMSNVIIRANKKTIGKIKKSIKEKSIEAIEMKQSARELASNLSNVTKDWGRDWLRISYYIMHEAYNTGRGQRILNDYGEDAEVYFDVFKDACHKCKELYLKNPNNLNSEPIVFKLKDILANGNNIGLKADDWNPTVDPIHPFCRCIINYKNPKYDWDETTRSFSKVRKIEREKLNIKIRKS